MGPKTIRQQHGSRLNMAEIEFLALARQCLNKRIGSLNEVARQVKLWTDEGSQHSVRVHWSFTVGKAEVNLKSWYEKVNPANKPQYSTN